MIRGTIIKGIGGFYYVDTGEEVLECKARGLFRKKDLVPLPGDNVMVELNEPGFGTIINLLDRATQMLRPAVANVDQLLIVVACASPQPDLMLVDKLLLMSQVNNIFPFLVVNKSDLVEYKEIEEICSQYRYFDRIVVSSSTGHGINELVEKMTGKISAFAGQSGVGKSSLLNRVFNSSVMETGQVSDKIQRGRHTTRHAELFKLKGGGFIVDTPGFSSIELEKIQYDKVWRYYPEMKDIGDNCRFKGCIHMSEPSCIVKNYTQDGGISNQRYERYVQLVTELKEAYDNRWK